MTKTPQNDIIAGPQAVDLAGNDLDAPINEKTALKLQTICEQTGEAYDGNLTEGQARERIAALHEAYGAEPGD